MATFAPGKRARWPVRYIVDSSLIARYDGWYGGPYTISGTTKKIGSPDTPFSCLVILYDEHTKRPVRSMFSAPSGDYAFTGLAYRPFFVVAFDHTNEYGAVIASNQFGV